MSLVGQVTNKPWLNPDPETDQVVAADPTFDVPNQKVALTVFLGTASVIFSLMVVAYFIRMQLGDWVPLSLPAMIWINTATLIASSVAFHLTMVSARSAAPAMAQVRLLLLVSGLLAIAFIGGQYLVWQQLSATGFHPAVNPANGFFYLLTSVHVVHLLGGLWVWSRTVLRLLRSTEVGEAKLSIELCTWYWHFLLLVWFGLLYLLATT
jgi:cytochrome c oxidase subunit 3